MLSRWQSTIVDAQGNVQPFAILSILNEETQAPAQIYASESGSQPLPVGTVVADDSGYAYFYAPGGLYRIQSAELDIDWRHVPLGSAAHADIVGTVSQSGGVPTGAIIERGSNANGSYTKFADGTMLCVGSFTYLPESTDGQAVPLPASFLSASYYSVTLNSQIGSSSNSFSVVHESFQDSGASFDAKILVHRASTIDFTTTARTVFFQAFGNFY